MKIPLEGGSRYVRWRDLGVDSARDLADISDWSQMKIS